MSIRETRQDSISKLPDSAISVRPVDIEDDEFVYYTGIRFESRSVLIDTLRLLEAGDCLSGDKVLDILSVEGDIVADFPFGIRGLAMLSGTLFPPEVRIERDVGRSRPILWKAEEG